MSFNLNPFIHIRSIVGTIATALHYQHFNMAFSFGAPNFFETRERVELKAYKLQEDFVCSLSISDSNSDSEASLTSIKTPTTVIILDRSGSMGNSVRRITNEVLPLFFEKLSYEPESQIHLITFDCVCESFKCKVGDLRNLQIISRGQTMMSPAIHELTRLFSGFDKS